MHVLEETCKANEGAEPIGRGCVQRLRAIAPDALARMHRPNEPFFAFRLRRLAGRDVLEGSSPRYTAIVLIGLAAELQETTYAILGGRTREHVCGSLLDAVQKCENLGDVALTLWAARAVRHPGVPKALDRLEALDPAAGRHPTVELAWALAALSIDGDLSPNHRLASTVARRLSDSFRNESQMFPHWPVGTHPMSPRSHVACFADLVYPIQALSYYGAAAGDVEALGLARRCADRMCETQGADGQWWWHFDVRTGRVIERYPVYAVHQDAMAPMALFAAQEACGTHYDASIQRGLDWLVESPEIGGSLVDMDNGLVWRKVARHEPGKLSRRIQAVTSGIHPGLRLPGLDRLFRPGRIDLETRPYHMGWLLYAWSVDRAARFSPGRTGGKDDHTASNMAGPPPL